MALDSTNLIARAELGRVICLQGRCTEAIAITPKIIDLQAGYMGGGLLGYEYARAGRRADALATLHQLEARARQRYIAPEAFAFIAIGLGDTTTALDWLERAYQQRSFYLALLNDPLFDPLRGSPRFQTIVHGVGLRIPPTVPPR